MKLIKTNRTSKGKVGGKNYYYNPIVELNGKYFLCKTIKTPIVLDAKTMDINSLELMQEIKPEFYKANNLPELVNTLKVSLLKNSIADNVFEAGSKIKIVSYSKRANSGVEMFTIQSVLYPHRTMLCEVSNFNKYII